MLTLKNTSAAFEALAATALVILLGGCTFAGPVVADTPQSEGVERGEGAEGLGFSSGEASPSPSGCPNPHGGSCLGPLAAGQYRTTTFEPEITYTVPGGWTNIEDLRGNLVVHLRQDSRVASMLRSPGPYATTFPATDQEDLLGGSYLGIYRHIHAPAMDCSDRWQGGVGTTPAELVAWYQTVPGLIVSEPVPVDIGGLNGLQVDFSLEPGADLCSFGPYAGIPLVIGNGVSQLHHLIIEEVDIRLVILAWSEGNVTLEIANLRTQHTADEFRSLLRPILDSLVFEG